MTIFLIILSILLWIGAGWCLFGRPALAPLLSLLALNSLSFMTRNGYKVLPLNDTILIGWFAMTFVVICATIFQPEAVRRQTRGTAYMLVGALVGMALGLLGFSIGSDIAMRYGLMILATAVGVVLGFLLYTNTPDGCPVRPGSGRFFRLLLAKGFPTAITVMQLGVALVVVIAMANVNAL